jgi:anti-anti-sigma factor
VAESLQFQENPTGLFIKARGHITAAVCADLREVILERLGNAAPAILAADLEECEYMDSTFMGLLVGFHKRYKTLTGRSLMVLRPSKECVKLLSGLGILKLMEQIDGLTPASPEQWQDVVHGQKPSAEVILGAHRNLIELSPENQQKFSLLQEALEQEVRNKP